MTQAAWTRDGRPVDAAAFSIPERDQLKESTQLGDFLMPCCRAPAVLKTSVNGLPFFAHLADKCVTAPETQWHRSGKAVVLAALNGMGSRGAYRTTLLDYASLGRTSIYVSREESRMRPEAAKCHACLAGGKKATCPPPTIGRHH
ncbi:hypothetical protein [Burkholderia anthina]|uniref:hypothetical protein n=1 Tax=Burkholderia anthina TaxID=179879 RepID=UPI001ABA0D77|nr:hypothetical protein [Burkholderia anthina]